MTNQHPKKSDDDQIKMMYQDLNELKNLGVKAGPDASTTIDETLYGENILYKRSRLIRRNKKKIY